MGVCYTNICILKEWLWQEEKLGRSKKNQHANPYESTQNPRDSEGGLDAAALEGKAGAS